MLLQLLARQAYRDGHAILAVRVYPDAAAERLRLLFDISQTDTARRLPGAVEFRRVAGMKDASEMILRNEASRVFNRDAERAAASLDGKRDRSALGDRLDCIGDEIV